MRNNYRPLTRLTATRRATLASRGEGKDYLTAIGDTVDPVPPWIFKGCIMKVNS